MIKIVTCQYQLESLGNWESYTRKITSLVIQAKDQDAQLLLLPEYAGTEIAGWHSSDKQLYAALQPLIPQYLKFYQHLSQHYQIHIQPGTIPVEVSSQQYLNRAYFFGPEGRYGFQDKLQLVAFEKTTTQFVNGTHQTIFDTSLGKIGIAICYDSEFPEIVRRLVNAGAWLILVPSYTNSLASYHRVFLSCRARAIENQCYIATSIAVGFVELSEESEYTVGTAAIVGPADRGFPDDGIITQGSMNERMLISAELFPEKISLVRQQGDVRNFEDAKFLDALFKNEINISKLHTHH